MLYIAKTKLSIGFLGSGIFTVVIDKPKTTKISELIEE